MAMGMDINIRILVTPETLKSTAADFEQIEREALGCVNNMIERINGLGGKWKGDASQAYIRKFANLRDDMERIFQMITEHVEDLKTMADRYEKAERESQELIDSTLVDDVIV